MKQKIAVAKITSKSNGSLFKITFPLPFASIDCRGFLYFNIFIVKEKQYLKLNWLCTFR